MSRRRLGVGFLGTGRISDLHALAYRDTSAAQVVALCDRDPELARKRGEAWGLSGVAIHGDAESLLARPDVDLVEILLPHHLHVPVALQALAAGKMVSLQKPMATSLAEADRLVAAVEAAGRPFRVFENFLFYPPVLRARELVEQGAIGTPVSIRIKSHSGTSRTAWPVPEAASRWRQNRAESGGGPLVFDDGHHKFALAWHFMGMAEEVHAFIGRMRGPDGLVRDAPSVISFRFPGNRVGSLEVVHSPGMELESRYYAQDDRVEITGTEGVLWISGGHGRLADTPPLVVYRDGAFTTMADMATGWEQSFLQASRHFLTCLAEDRPAMLSARDARRVLRFALAAEESGRSGEVVRVDTDA